MHSKFNDCALEVQFDQIFKSLKSQENMSKPAPGKPPVSSPGQGKPSQGQPPKK